MMIGVGRVMTGTDEGNAGFLQVRLNDREIPDRIMNSQHYGFSSSATPGADAVTLFMSGDRSKGIVIATGDQRYRFALKNGEVSIWDNQGQKVHLQQSGITVLDKSSNQLVTTATGITLTDKSGSSIVMAEGSIALNPSTGSIALNGPITGGKSDGTAHSLKGSFSTTGDQVAGAGTTDAISQLGHEHNVTGVGAPTTAPIAGT